MFGADVVVRGERVPPVCRETAGAVLHLGHHQPCPDCGAEWGTIAQTDDHHRGNLICRECSSEFVAVIQVSVALTHEQVSAVESVARSTDTAAAAVVRNCIDDGLPKVRDALSNRHPREG